MELWKDRRTVIHGLSKHTLITGQVMWISRRREHDKRQNNIWYEKWRIENEIAWKRRHTNLRINIIMLDVWNSQKRDSNNDIRIGQWIFRLDKIDK